MRKMLLSFRVSSMTERKDLSTGSSSEKCYGSGVRGGLMIVPLTREIIDKFYSDLPATVKGFAVVEDDEVLGLMGLYRADGKCVVFSQITDELKKRKKELIRLTRKVESLRSWVGVCDCRSGA